MDKNVQKAIAKYLIESHNAMLKNYNLTDKEIKQLLLKIDFKDINMSELSATGGIIKGSNLDRVVKSIQSDFRIGLRDIIEKSMYKSWSLSHNLYDIMVNAAYTNLSKEAIKALIPKRKPIAHRQLFKDRHLSKRIWELSEDYKKNIKDALRVGHANGESADKVARRVMRYSKSAQERIKDIDKLGDSEVAKILARRKTNKKGSLGTVFKDAKRLAGNERNILFREAENQNMQSPYVLGFTIGLSNAHPRVDICDYVMGDYPVWFKWNGWHPNCLCHRTFILASQEEIKAYYKAKREGKTYEFKGKITDVPANFKAYMSSHFKQMNSWKSKPYFLIDNNVSKLLE